MFANILRRFAVRSTSAVLQWTLDGLEDADGNVETETAEVFGVAGVVSRPPAEARAEVILAYLGGKSNAPVILVTRDADTLRAFLDKEGLELDESALYNTQAAFRVTEDGKAVARSLGGESKPLPTLEDVQAIIDALTNSATAAQDGGATYKANITAALTGRPQGTSVLEGE